MVSKWRRHLQDQWYKVRLTVQLYRRLHTTYPAAFSENKKNLKRDNTQQQVYSRLCFVQWTINLTTLQDLGNAYLSR